MNILTPFPFSFRLAKEARKSAILGSLFFFLGLMSYYIWQSIWNLTHNEPIFVPQSRAVAIGDGIALPIFAAATAFAFVGYQVREKKFYHSKWWFMSIGCGALIFFVAKDAKWLAGNIPVIVHAFIQAPIFATLVIGVLPHLLFDIQGRWISRCIACSAGGLYLWAAYQDRFWEHISLTH